MKDYGLTHSIDRVRAQTRGVLDRVAPSPAELAEIDAAFARADSIAGIVGVAASRPVAGETANAYRRRLIAAVQPHSAKFKAVDLSRLSPDLLRWAEQEIFADAVATARSGQNVPPGETRMIQWRDEAGRLITGYVGREYTMGGCWDVFTRPGARGSINRPEGNSK